MIERARELRHTLSDLTKLNTDLPGLSDEEWKLLDVVARLLSIFDGATQALSADKYPTLNKTVPICNYYLFSELDDFRDACDGKARDPETAAIIGQCSPVVKGALKNAIQAAHEKLGCYYGRTWADIYAIAVILDPRHKTNYYQLNKRGQRHIAHAKNALLGGAVEKYGTIEEPQSSQDDDMAQLGWVEQSIFQISKRRRVGGGSEMRNYLATDTASPGENVLGWWKLVLLNCLS